MPLKRPLHLPSLLLTLTFTLTSACLFTQTETPDQDMGSGNNTTPPVNNTTPVNNTSPNNSTTPVDMGMEDMGTVDMGGGEDMDIPDPCALIDVDIASVCAPETEPARCETVDVSGCPIDCGACAAGSICVDTMCQPSGCEEPSQTEICGDASPECVEVVVNACERTVFATCDRAPDVPAAYCSDITLPLPAEVVEEARFGESIHTSSERIAVGAPGFNNANNPNKGAVYVYDIPTEGFPTEPTKVTPPAEDLGLENFGKTVYLTSNNQLLVASPTKNAGANIVFVYRFVEGKWEEQADQRIEPAESTAGGTEFGHAIAVFNGVLFIGAPSTLNGASGTTGATGAVHVYERTNSEDKIFQPRVTLVNPGRMNNFGFALAPYIDQEGEAAVLIGAPGDLGDDMFAINAGMVYTSSFVEENNKDGMIRWEFSRARGLFTIDEAATANYDNLGSAIVVRQSADTPPNQPRRYEAWVGAPSTDQAKTKLFYLIQKDSSGEFVEDSYDKPDLPFFGSRLAVYGEVLIGSALALTAKVPVFVLPTKPGGPAPAAFNTIQPLEQGNGDIFGAALEITEDFVLVGAPNARHPDRNRPTGVVHVFPTP